MPWGPRGVWANDTTRPPTRAAAGAPAHRVARAVRWIREHYAVITFISGLILIGMGLLMVTGELTQLNRHAQDALDSVGLDVFNR